MESQMRQPKFQFKFLCAMNSACPVGRLLTCWPEFARSSALKARGLLLLLQHQASPAGQPHGQLSSHASESQFLTRAPITLDPKIYELKALLARILQNAK